MFTQCSKCETVFTLSAEILRAAGGQVRCGKCGEVFNALAHLAEDPSAFTIAETEIDLEFRADSILESPAPMTRPPPPPAESEDFARPGVEIARLQIMDWDEHESSSVPDEQIEDPADEQVGETSMEFTLPPGELDRIFVESKKRAQLPQSSTSPEPRAPRLVVEKIPDSPPPPPARTAAPRPAPRPAPQPAQSAQPTQLSAQPAPPSALPAPPSVQPAPPSAQPPPPSAQPPRLPPRPPLQSPPPALQQPPHPEDIEIFIGAAPEEALEATVELAPEPAREPARTAAAQPAREAAAAQPSREAAARQPSREAPARKPSREEAVDAAIAAAPSGFEVSEDVRREMLSGLESTADGEAPFAHEKAARPVRRRASPFAFTPQQATRSFMLWLIAAIASGLLLIVQLAHQNREWLAAHARLGGAGAPANLSVYQLRQWGVTGDPAADGTLRVRASILNTAAQLEPYPLLRVTLANRFGGSIGTRDFEPFEYLGKPTVKLLAPGERIDATMDILDPGKNAEGFEIDVCLRGADKKVSCANDAAPAPLKR